MYCLQMFHGDGILEEIFMDLPTSIGEYVVHFPGVVLCGLVLSSDFIHSMNAYVIMMSSRNLIMACLTCIVIFPMVCICGCSHMSECALLAWYARTCQCFDIYVCSGMPMEYFVCS